MSRDAKEPLISIVILNWNGIEDTLLCLNSVRELTYTNYEIIVIDNGSTNDSVQILEQQKGIKLILNKKNRGFAGGHTDGLKHASGEYILILNNDALISADYLDKSLKHFNDPKVAVVGGRAYHLDDNYRKHSTFYTFQVLNPITSEAITLSHDYGGVSIVNNVSGSCALIRRSVINKLGYFDNKYFAYFEEIDLFARFKRAGYKVVYDPELAIWHKGGASTKNKPFKFYYLMYRNRFRFALRNFEKSFIWPFLKTYFAHGGRSALRFIKHRGVQEKAEAAAAIRNVFMLLPTLLNRLALGRKLPQNYSHKIIEEQLERVSVVIDATTNPSQLTRCLTSIGKQSMLPRDIVVVSAEESLLNHQELKLRHVKYSNKTFSPYNLGIVAATNEWVLLLQASDELENNNLISNTLYESILSKSNFSVFTESASKINMDQVSSSLSSGELNRKVRIFITKDAVHDTFGSRVKISLQAAAWISLAKALAKGYKVNYYEIRGGIKTSSSSLFDQDKSYANEIKNSIDKQLLYSSRIHAALVRLAYKPKQRRLQQLLILVVWCLSPSISWRLKLGRCRDLSVALLTLSRKKVAVTLRHIRNEFSQGVHPENLNLIPEDKSSVPVLIICRDMLSTLKSMVSWLEQHNLNNIILLDNASSYPQLLNYYANTKHQVVPIGRNIGTQSPWVTQAIPLLAYEAYYILTDPDILPVDECPNDFLDYFFSIHQKYPSYLKVGFGLKIDDLPERYLLRKQVVQWEEQFWKIEIEKNVYEAGIDTTFALYKPNTYAYFINPAIRTAGKYLARHLPWYADSTKPSEEDIYYKEHRSMLISSWTADELPERFVKELERMDDEK